MECGGVTSKCGEEERAITRRLAAPRARETDVVFEAFHAVPQVSHHVAIGFEEVVKARSLTLDGLAEIDDLASQARDLGGQSDLTRREVIEALGGLCAKLLNLSFGFSPQLLELGPGVRTEVLDLIAYRAKDLNGEGLFVTTLGHDVDGAARRHASSRPADLEVSPQVRLARGPAPSRLFC